LIFAVFLAVPIRTAHALLRGLLDIRRFVLVYQIALKSQALLQVFVKGEDLVGQSGEVGKNVTQHFAVN